MENGNPQGSPDSAGDGQSTKNIVGIGSVPEGAICYRHGSDGCKRKPFRTLAFDDETGCFICRFHYELGKVDGTRLFVVDKVEPNVLEGFLSSVVMYRVRCPHCDSLIEYDNQILFTPDEYNSLPNPIQCDNEECGKLVIRPDGYPDPILEPDT